MSGQGPPAGWYPDPEGDGQRWWDGQGWTDRRPGRNERSWKGPAIFAAVAIALSVVFGVVTAQDDPPSRSDTISRQAEDPLDQMVVAFQGDWTRDQISSRIDEALRLYGHQVNDDQRSRAGSTLVSIRREYGITEMHVLDFMICQHTPDVDLNFPDGAAIAVTSIQAGDRCA